MDRLFVLYAETVGPGSSFAAQAPLAIDTHSNGVSLFDLGDNPVMPESSWFTAKEGSLFRFKEDPVSPIKLDRQDSNDTLTSSESVKKSLERNSFGSIVRDASFLEFYTEVVGAMNQQKTTDTVCQIHCKERFFRTLKTFECKIKTETTEVTYRAKRALCLDLLYTITQEISGAKPTQIAQIKETGPGAYAVYAGGKILGKITFRAKERNGVFFRLAEAACFTRDSTSSHLQLTPKHPEREQGIGRHQLKFDSELVVPSPKNFQMMKKDAVEFQMGMVEKRRFELRFGKSLEPLLAFGFGVCSLIQSNQ